jgi:hypothetical protein
MQQQVMHILNTPRGQALLVANQHHCMREHCRVVVMCAQVSLRLRGSVSSKQLGYEELLAPLIAEACIDVVPTNPHNFNVDNVRIVKILGG